MATPLGRVRGAGSAKSGTGNFILERVTSVVLLLLTPYVIGVFIVLAGKPREEASSWIGSISFAPALIAFIVISAAHMRAGMQVIVEDYVHAPLLKHGLLIANLIFIWGTALVSVFAILKIAFTLK
jgi:succinate dehydrogenase / fumarate reductase, membrane anchor subunit